VSEMDSMMEAMWNSAVSEDDLIYVLGDFAVRRPAYWNERLKGRKILILGTMTVSWRRRRDLFRYRKH